MNSKKKRSYPTYEEWKQFSVAVSTANEFTVLILPMRNGNIIKPIFIRKIYNVLILPMRNGNK